MTTDNRADKHDGASELDLRQILGTLLDHKWMIGGVTTAFFVVAVAYALLATPVYRADAVVQVESKVPSLPGLSNLSQTLGVSSKSAEASTEIALITSRAVIGNAVDQMRLDVLIEPSRFPVLGSVLARRFEAKSSNEVSAPLFGLSRFGWGGEKLQIFQLKVPQGLLDQGLTLVAGAGQAYSLLDPDGNVLLQGVVGKPATQGGVSIEVETLRANQGARFSVTKLRRLGVVSDLQRQIAVSETGKDAGILRMTYEDANPSKAQALLQAVAVAYVRQNVERNSAEATAQLAFVKEQLPNVRRQVDSSQELLTKYQMRANSVDLTLQTKGLLDQEVAVETSIQQLRLQQAEMDRKFTRDHPAYQALVRQLSELEGRKANFQGQVRKLPDAQQELLKLTRDLQVGNEMYTSLLGQAQQLDVARAGTVGNVRIVDAAAVDDTSPVKPQKPIVVAAGTFLGLILAIGFVFLRQLINRGIEDPAEIEELGMPVYASIPTSVNQQSDSVRGKFKGDGKLHILAVKDPADLAVEAIRSLRTSLHFARLEAKNNVVLFSGSSPSAGKTFVSSNLAAVMAQAGQKVLVIDADMRKGTLHKALGVSQSPGLSDVLIGRATIDDAVRSLPELDGLHFITRGDVPPNPSELLMHENFTNLIRKVEPMFDVVIIDTPPILAVTDAAVIAHHAGTCLLVTRFALNQVKEIALAKSRFEQNGVRLKGAVFNAVERRAVGYYSYGYYEYKSSH